MITLYLYMVRLILVISLWNINQNQSHNPVPIKPHSTLSFYTYDIHFLAGHECERAPGITTIHLITITIDSVYTTTAKNLFV